LYDTGTVYPDARSRFVIFILKSSGNDFFAKYLEDSGFF